MWGAIVAVDEAGGIGKMGLTPWRIPEDLAFFKKATQGGVLLMGRVTWEEIGRPLLGRQMVVVTSAEPSPSAPGVAFVKSVREGRTFAESTGRPLWVIGGVRVWEEMWDRISLVHITRVVGVHGADRFWGHDLAREGWAKVAERPIDRLDQRVAVTETWVLHHHIVPKAAPF